MVPLSRSKVIAGTSAALALVPRALRPQTLAKLRMGAVPTDDMTPVFYALRNGLFQKAGIELDVNLVSSGSASTAAVVGGAYELGKASPVAAMLAHLHGLPVTIVANGAVNLARAPYSGMLVAAHSPIKTAVELNGATGGTPGLNDTSQLSIQNWVDKNGGDSKSMKWVELPGSAIGAAIAEQRIDVAVLTEPLLSAALEGGRVRVLADAQGAVADRWLSGAYLAQPDWANAHAEIVRRFAQVMYAAAAYTNTHKAETVAMMAEVTKISIGVFQRMTRIECATSADPALLQPIIDLAVRYKLFARAFPPREMYWTG